MSAYLILCILLLLNLVLNLQDVTSVHPVSPLSFGVFDIIITLADLDLYFLPNNGSLRGRYSQGMVGIPMSVSANYG